MLIIAFLAVSERTVTSISLYIHIRKISSFWDSHVLTGQKHSDLKTDDEINKSVLTEDSACY